MYQEYMTKIKVGEKEYELLLTTKATRKSPGAHGDLENLGDKLMKAENF